MDRIVIYRGAISYIVPGYSSIAIKFERKIKQEMVKYNTYLEEAVRKYPYQGYNFYGFWV